MHAKHSGQYAYNSGVKHDKRYSPPQNTTRRVYITLMNMNALNFRRKFSESVCVSPITIQQRGHTRICVAKMEQEELQQGEKKKLRKNRVINHRCL